MKRTFPTAFRLGGALLCLFCGLLLWSNVTLHFAEIEEILPGLRASNLLVGKEGFLILVATALLCAILMAFELSWKKLFQTLNRPRRTLIATLFFATSFIPLFWLRFGGPAWILLLLLAVSFFLNLVGILMLSSWLAQRIELPRLVPSKMWNFLHPWLPAALLFATAVYFSHYCFDFIPHVEDSIAQLIQARIFASGHATAEPFLPKEFFFFGFMVDSNRWFSQYPPGHPLVLALGVLMGTPYLVNPLLGFAGVLLFYYLLKGSDGGGTARWAAWAMALSPYVVFMSSEYMNHTTTLVSSLIGWLALKKGEGGRIGWLLLSGLGFGYCTATRPLEGAIFAAIGGVYLLFTIGGLKFSSLIKALPYGIGFLVAVSLYAIHNALTTGNPLVTGYSLTWGGTGLGLGDVNWGPPHTFGYGLVNTFMSIAGLNVYLYEIPIPALLGVFLWAFWGARLSRWDKAFLAAMILVPFGYLFYYFHDYCFGPRYYYVIVPQLIYFSIKGVRALYERLVNHLEIPEEVVKRGLVWAGIMFILLQLFVALPYRASVYADSYWGTSDGPMKEARRLNLSNAIVFIENHPWEILETKLHSLDFIMGDAHRMLYFITLEGLDEVLTDMGYDPQKVWGTQVSKKELERRIYDWNRAYLKKGNPPLDPWAERGSYTYYSNGAGHLDPRHRDPEVILARDLGEHNRALMEMYPDRKAYRYAYDRESGRLRILPLK